MSRAEKIIRQVIEELSPRQGEVVSGGTYEDEPILRTGRQLLEAQQVTARQTQRLDRPRSPQQEREASLSSSKRVSNDIIREMRNRNAVSRKLLECMDKQCFHCFCSVAFAAH